MCRVWSNYKLMLKGTCSNWIIGRPWRKLTSVVSTPSTWSISFPADTIIPKNVFISERNGSTSCRVYGATSILSRTRKNWWRVVIRTCWTFSSACCTFFISEHDEIKIEMLPIKKNRNIKFFMVYFSEIVLVFWTGRYNIHELKSQQLI